MEDQAKVQVVRDQGTKNRWALTRFVYRNDGGKKTLDTRRLYWFLGVAFLVVVVALCLQGNPDVVGKSGIRTPEESSASANAEKGIEFPKFEQGQKVVTDATAQAPRKGKARSKYVAPQVIHFSAKEMPPGTMGQAKLVTGASNGPVRAELVEAMTYNGVTYAAPGTVLIGTGSSTEERLFLRFNQMVFRDGSVQTIRAQAYDSSDKIPGLKGSSLGNFGIKLAGSIGLNFVGGVSEGLQESEGQAGVAIRKNTLKNALLNGASVAALDESKDLMSSLKNRTPIMEVPAETIVLVVSEGN